MKFKSFIIFVCLFVVELLYSTNVFSKDISILTKGGTISYSVEMADTPELQQKGLMFRKSLPQNQGMLFDFNHPKPVFMWMKNTYIPLDMLFVDEKGIIRHIHENAQPMDESIISCPIPVKYVIELNAGQVKTNNIQISNQVILNLKEKI